MAKSVPGSVKLFAGALFGALVLTSNLSAADLSLPVSGNLLGSVVDSAGIPQTGATVQLFDKYERLIGKTLSSTGGKFGFSALSVDRYSVRVSLASFLPATRQGILVKAGLDSMLQIHLATLFSNVELTYIAPVGMMNEDWKWVLRSSAATRPITRLVAGSSSSSSESKRQIFSSTHAVLSLSGGESGAMGDDRSIQSDIGTGFALSTNFLGNNQLSVRGMVGQNGGAGSPAIALCATYSPAPRGFFHQAPEVTVTMRQLALGSGDALASNSAGGPFPNMRDVSISTYDALRLSERLELEYGSTAETVAYVNHTSRVSPFARLTFDAGKAGQFQATYSNGGRPDPLYVHQQGPRQEQQSATTDSGAVAHVPQLSARDGQLALQRTQNYEAGYSKTLGSRTLSASGFYEDVRNGRVSVAGDTSSLNNGDLLSDEFSKTSAYNVGRYRRAGYIAAVTQRVNESLDVALAYGRLSGFSARGSSGMENGSSVTAQQLLMRDDPNFATVNLHARVPVSGTRLTANYGWVDGRVVVPSHIFTTANVYAEPGFNVVVRQPLPSFGLPGRLEVVADLHNMLAQGYLPINTMDGRRLMIIQAPRAVRGGVNFVF